MILILFDGILQYLTHDCTADRTYITFEYCINSFKNTKSLIKLNKMKEINNFFINFKSRLVEVDGQLVQKSCSDQALMFRYFCFVTVYDKLSDHASYTCYIQIKSC